MKENKTQIRGLIVLAIIAVMYSVVVFAVPFAKNTVTFWFSYMFTLAAIGAQYYVMKTAFSKGKDAKSKFYGFPIAKIGVTYLIVQLVLGLLFMALAAYVPVWLPIVLYVVILGVSAIGFIAADVTRDEIERQDMKLKKDVSNMRALQSLSSSMVGLCTNDETKKAVQDLMEEFRFSDPVSSEQTKELEEELMHQLQDAQKAIIDEDNAAVKVLCARIKNTLTERNRLCALNK
ncbi:MAG: hypothetical protein J1F63_07900 [Oscillospiraceae bacterium]|nr:hypothetical protein [Oscillospiraceae bacterium]